MKSDNLDGLQAILLLLISDLADFLNVGNNISVPQIQQTIYLIIQEYPHLKIDDFVICFNRAKSGYYGKSYNRFDGMVIMEWVKEYDFERSMEIENHHQNNNNRIKKGINHVEVEEGAIPMPDHVKEFIKKIGKENNESHIRTVSESFYQSEIQKFYRQFDHLYEKYGESSGGVRFLSIGGKKIDSNEFLKLKINSK